MEESEVNRSDCHKINQTKQAQKVSINNNGTSNNGKRRPLILSTFSVFSQKDYVSVEEIQTCAVSVMVHMYASECLKINLK